ncbi:hypothetical protein [Pseudomonas phage Almagne]|nr:hypothetical protein [Pseudomonas phage Almagne]
MILRFLLVLLVITGLVSLVVLPYRFYTCQSEGGKMKVEQVGRITHLECIK